MHHSGDKEAHHSCSKATAEIAHSFALLLHWVRLPNPAFRGRPIGVRDPVRLIYTGSRTNYLSSPAYATITYYNRL